MDGFVQNSVSNSMSEDNCVSMFDSASAPIINTLAKEFAVFDRWFCSIPGPTDPNRAYAMSGSSFGELHNFNGTLWSQQSYFDYLRTHNHTFSAYYQDDPWAVMYFEDTHKLENYQFIHDLDTHFFDDVAAGKLPEFTWLQPRMGPTKTKLPSWQHPDASIREGERLIKDVYEALRSSPVWNETLFIITYDEHGGFYDHVAPPHQGVPSPDGIPAYNGFNFDQLGIRVPTIAISPWINANTVVSEGLPGEMPTSTSAFDSTSILATSNLLLGVEAEPMGKRMAWANTFAGLVKQRTSPRTDCPEKLPDLPASSTHSLEEQRAKPLNHHLESQIHFYCKVNSASVEVQQECIKTSFAALTNQGLATDWILDQVKLFRLKLESKSN